MGHLHELNAEECVRLLRLGVAGRVALSTPDGPHIIPVNYAVADGAVVFRTTPYSVLGTYGPSSLLAFEVDHMDYEYHQGWSVVARGRGQAVVDPVVIRELTRGSDPRPWAHGTRSLLIELRWTELTGRRVGSFIGEEHDVPAGLGGSGGPRC